jgi:hypothetical protein
MKTPLFAVTVVFTSLVCCAGDLGTQSLPDIEQLRRTLDPGEPARAEFEKSGAAHHKWKKGMPLPTSLQEVGLLPDVKRVWSGRYLDGGTVGYLFRDSHGGYLALCTGPGIQSKGNPQRIDAAIGSRLFIGALHYRNKEAQMVDPGSASARFLWTLISEANNAMEGDR